jgi:hypothetical protein
MFFVNSILKRSHLIQVYDALVRSSKIMAAYLIAIMLIGAQFLTDECLENGEVCCSHK